MAYPKALRIDAIRVLGFGAITNLYQVVGAALTEPCRIFNLTNLTNANIIFSLDGVNDHFYIPPGGFKLIDVCTNRVRDEGWFVPQGTQFYCRSDGLPFPTTGNVIIEVMHG